MEKQTVRLKGTAYPANVFFWKKAHPRRWKWRQFVKKVVHKITFGTGAIHFKYPDPRKK